jgi:hypothetical protein
MIDETEINRSKNIRIRLADDFLLQLAAGGRCDYLPGETQIPIPTVGKVTMPDKASIRQEAEAVAISALGFIASDPELLPRFLAITGIEASSIRRAASEPGFLAGVLQFILAHEPTLLRFAEETGVPPASVGEAQKHLPTGDDRYESST